MSPAIEVRNLTKTYPGGVHAVRGINFSVEPGEAFGLLGPNGAGKSTTVGMLTTTVLPTSGRAMVGGFDVSLRPLDARAVSGVVFQDAVVDRPLSGRRNLDIHARLWNVAPSAAGDSIRELAGAMGLSELLDRPLSTYSGGQRRRLEIARALVSRPRVLFLDEPTVGLDPRIRAELLDLIAGLRDRTDTTILLTTHYLDEAERLCDRIAIMHEGRIVALDTPAALRRSLGESIVELRTSDHPDSALETLRAQGLAGPDAFSIGSTITVPLDSDSPADVVAAIHASDVRATAVTTRQPTLDDVYLRLTGGQLNAAA
jgi:ABC-2 type transport system ATP-binding protein